NDAVVAENQPSACIALEGVPVPVGAHPFRPVGALFGPLRGIPIDGRQGAAFDAEQFGDDDAILVAQRDVAFNGAAAALDHLRVTPPRDRCARCPAVPCDAPYTDRHVRTCRCLFRFDSGYEGLYCGIEYGGTEPVTINRSIRGRIFVQFRKGLPPGSPQAFDSLERLAVLKAVFGPTRL